MKKRWPWWLEDIEHTVDFILPILLIPLTLIIVLEFTVIGELYHNELLIADSIIVMFFIIDLCFKYARTKTTKLFIKLYWLDILAVLPFYSMFRVINSIREFFVVSEQANRLLHEAVLIREARLLTEADAAFRLSREARMARTGTRLLRLITLHWNHTNWFLAKTTLGVKKRKQQRVLGSK